MRHGSALIVLSMMGLAMFSCKKNSGPAPAPTIVHNWNVVSDSVFFGSNSTRYAGKYFNFTSDGEVNFSTDYLTTGSIKYQVISDSIILIGQTIANGELETIGNGSFDGIWKIKKLTDKSLTIQSGGIVPSMGWAGETIHLSR